MPACLFLCGLVGATGRSPRSPPGRVNAGERDRQTEEHMLALRALIERTAPQTETFVLTGYKRGQCVILRERSVDIRALPER